MEEKGHKLPIADTALQMAVDICSALSLAKRKVAQIVVRKRAVFGMPSPFLYSSMGGPEKDHLQQQFPTLFFVVPPN